MSQSPLAEVTDPGTEYLGAFARLSQRIRDGQSFSGGERNCAFFNLGDDTFADLSFALGLDAADDGRGIALTDLDADGDVDLCLTNRTAPRLRLMRNDLLDGNRSLTLRLEGDPAKGTPRDAIGARVEVMVAGVTRHRSLAAGDGFASQSTKWLHIGLGKTGEIDSVKVRWPGGGTEGFAEIKPGGRYMLKQGSGAAVETAMAPLAKPLLAGQPNLPEPTETGRIRLSQPLKLPADLAFASLDGARTPLSSLTADGTILLNLWASYAKSNG